MFTYHNESDKNKKALLITTFICLLILLIFFLVRFSHTIIPNPTVVQDLIEINLGNNEGGDGDEQPVIKGNKTIPTETTKSQENPTTKSDEEKVNTSDDNDPESAVINKSENKRKKVQDQTNVENTALKNKKAKLIYNGPDKGKNGNNSETDNNYKYQGNQQNGKGDNGDPTGDKDSYGDTHGGKTGGPKVIKGNRKIIQRYQFEGDLNKATIYAIIKVSPSGIGDFQGFDKGSTKRSQAYANAIEKYLKNIQFNKSQESSIVTVEFIFDIR